MGAIPSASAGRGSACGLPTSPRHFLRPRHFFTVTPRAHLTMADEDVNLYDEIEIEDCFYDETLQIYHHPCPCGDRFEISIADMRDGEDIARCPSCSLMIRIIFDEVNEYLVQTLRAFVSANMALSV
jgi:diphthamide biosynthesis protein 3